MSPQFGAGPVQTVSLKQLETNQLRCGDCGSGGLRRRQRQGEHRCAALALLTRNSWKSLQRLQRI